MRKDTDIFSRLGRKEAVPDASEYLEREAARVLEKYEGAVNHHLVVMDEKGKILQQFRDGRDVTGQDAEMPFHKAGSCTKPVISFLTHILQEKKLGGPTVSLDRKVSEYLS